MRPLDKSEIPPHRWLPRYTRRILAAIFLLAAVFIVVTWEKTPLSDDERRMLGAWEWEDLQGTPQALVLYFHVDRKVRYDQAPFRSPSIDHWRIRDGNLILNHATRKPIDRLSYFIRQQKDVWSARLAGDIVYVTMSDGKERRLIRYDGPVPDSLTSLE